MDAVLKAAARVLRREGYERATTNRIAAVAGISVGSLYQYFPNKEALVAALIAEHSAAMWALFERRHAELASAPIPVAARDLIKCELDAHAVDPKLHQVLIEQVPRVGGLQHVNDVVARVTELVRGYLEAHRAELRPALRAADLAMPAFVVVSTVESIAHAAVLEHPEYLENDRLVDETTALVLGYLVG